jgi:diacylglycerol kinase family enzyme
MRVVLVVNPGATRFTGRLRDRVVRNLAAEHKVEVRSTSHAGQATELARAAVTDGAEVVVAMGGDGTVNEVVNGLAGTDVPLGLVGGGKTNVFARALGLPGSDTMRATARLLELLASGARRRISLGMAGGRRFTFGAGLGLDGAIVREVERRRRAKQLYGDHTYVAAGLKTLLVGYDRDHPHLTVHLGDGRPTMSGFFALVGNGDPFTYFGPRPFRPTPQASYELGLEVLVAQSMSGLAITRAITGMLSPRPRPAYPSFPVLHDQHAFRLESDIPLAFQLDGEYLGDRTSVAFEHLPGALSVIAPGPDDRHRSWLAARGRR